MLTWTVHPLVFVSFCLRAIFSLYSSITDSLDSKWKLELFLAKIIPPSWAAKTCTRDRSELFYIEIVWSFYISSITLNWQDTSPACPMYYFAMRRSKGINDDPSQFKNNDCVRVCLSEASQFIFIRWYLKNVDIMKVGYSFFFRLHQAFLLSRHLPIHHHSTSPRQPLTNCDQLILFLRSVHSLLTNCDENVGR